MNYQKNLIPLIALAFITLPITLSAQRNSIVPKTTKNASSSATNTESKTVDKTNLIAQEILAGNFGLNNINVLIAAENVEEQNALHNNKINFKTALNLAMKSFMNDDEDCESPLGLVLDESNSMAEAKQTLFSFLNRPSTSIDLFATWQTPEHGESVLENWVFVLNMDDYTDHIHWAIVDRSGKTTTYNYGFN